MAPTDPAAGEEREKGDTGLAEIADMEGESLGDPRGLLRDPRGLFPPMLPREVERRRDVPLPLRAVSMLNCLYGRKGVGKG